MSRHLEPVEPRRSWFLATQSEIEAFFRERAATFAAMLEAERRARASEPEQLELEEAA